MKAVVAAFNLEKALVGAFSVLTNLRMELFQALESTSKQPKQPDCPPGVSFPRVPERGCSWRVAAPRCAGPGERAAVSVSWDSAAAAACRDPDTAAVRQHTFTRTLGPINSVMIGFVARLLEDNTSQNVYKSHVCVLKLCIVFNILHSKLQ